MLVNAASAGSWAGVRGAVLHDGDCPTRRCQLDVIRKVTEGSAMSDKKITAGTGAMSLVGKVKKTFTGENRTRISPLELVYGTAIICALVLGDTLQALLGVALGAVLLVRRSMQARHAHQILPSQPKNH